ncbi:MAG: hypothetical protein IPI44_16500 [Sulfuritalea sp.]|nr:hypothetical protein [Sulfuritalea sp.]
MNLADVKEHHLIRRGDLVFRSRGRTNSVALVLADIGPAVLAAPMLLIRPGEVLPAYLLWYINLPTVQATLAAQAEGTKSVQQAALRHWVAGPKPAQAANGSRTGSPPAPSKDCWSRSHEQGSVSRMGS